MDFSCYTLTLYALSLLLILLLLKSLKLWTLDAPSGNFPPGPWALPVIGNLHMINIKRPNETYMKLAKIYGPVYSIQMGTLKMVILSGYETVKSALVDYADDFSERGHIRIFEEINQGWGIPFSHGENWRAMRRFTLSKLRDFGMGKKTIEDRIIEECGFLTRKLESLEGKPTELTTKTNFAIGNIIISIILGHRLDYEDPALFKVMTIIDENMRLLGSSSIALYNVLPGFKYVSDAHIKIMKNVKELHTFFNNKFVEHLKTLDKDDQRGYIDAFLIKQEEEKLDPNTYFHENNLLSILTTLFMAGTDTTSSTIRWAITFMVLKPEIQKRVHDEIDKVIGSAVPRIDHRKDMPYTNAIIHETQRFANILPMNLPRETTRDVFFQGYNIPKGTYIIPLLESVLHDETQFEKPRSFYPEHFLGSEGQFVKRFAFMPFSAGRRVCVGETLAKMELFLFFTSLMQKFTFRPSPEINEFHAKRATGLAIPPISQKICCVSRI
ncbi:cytochrome P450 2K6-like isoform X1 [Ranitomeya imitator]|uniref:cytochrome P450 2K6-like isoform X1 n=1 Tax=Ranitomeya imitator TaxID=111125 RepID=UPI0037E7E412